jgi:hypothetical protein
MKTVYKMKSKTSPVFLYYFAFASFIFGTKLWLIGKFGNATPFWDQWDAEADFLYKPFIDGTLKFADLLAPHNEHRILTTRLLALLELTINGIWNPLLQMVVNSVLHIIVLVVVIGFIIRVIGRNYLPALLLFSAVLFALSYSWENTLAGFQSQFYFVLLFSIVSLWLTTTHEPFSFWWLGGFFCSILAFFSLASGIFCMAAAAAIGIIFYLFRFRRTYQQLAAAALFSGLFIVGVALTPVLAEHQFLKAGSASQFITALFHILWWPSPVLFLGLYQNSPVLLFAILMFKQKPDVHDKKWFFTALLIWILGTASSIAYGRALNPISSRYLDLFSISVLISFSCFLLILKESSGKWKKWTLFGLIIWILSLGVCLQIYKERPTRAALRGKQEKNIAEEINTKNYVATGYLDNLRNKPSEDIPYPSPERLVSILDSPEIRNILPANIAPPNRPVKEGRLDNGVNFLIANYYVFIGMGLLCALIGGLLSFFASAKKSEKIPV